MLDFDPIGAWNAKFAKAGMPCQLGDLNSYRIAAMLLDHLDDVEDWGCGTAFAKRFFIHAIYRGIDGSHSKWHDEISRLETRQSSPSGLLMRHVLEHNLRWSHVLDNALTCFKTRMVLIVFTNIVNETFYPQEPDGMPCISFARHDIVSRFKDLAYVEGKIGTDTFWVIEKQKHAIL